MIQTEKHQYTQTDQAYREPGPYGQRKRFDSKAHLRDSENASQMCFSYIRSYDSERRPVMQKLNIASEGRYTIKWIFTEPEIKSALSEIQIEVGKSITVLRRHPLGGSLLRSDAGSFFIDADILAGITV